MPTPVFIPGQVLNADDVNNWLQPLVAYKTAGTVRNTLSLSADPDLTLSLVASAFYQVSFAVVYVAASGGISWKWTVPAGATGGFIWGGNLSGTGEGTYGNTFAATICAGTLGGTVAGFHGMGYIQTVGTAGTFAVQWASCSGPASLTVGVGSVLQVQRVG